MSLVTVNNLYENGVCDEFTIYTGTTYNGDPYIIPLSAQSIGSHTLPHTFDVGLYEGPLYVFLVHCDFYVTPPPSDTPKRQGGFQVKLINIECPDVCPPFSPTTNCNSTVNFVEYYPPTTNCNFTVNFVEYYEINLTPTPSPTPTPSATTNCNSAVNFVEYYEVNLTPTPTPSATTNCDFNVDIDIDGSTPSITLSSHSVGGNGAVVESIWSGFNASVYELVEFLTGESSVTQNTTYNIIPGTYNVSLNGVSVGNITADASSTTYYAPANNAANYIVYWDNVVNFITPTTGTITYTKTS